MTRASPWGLDSEPDRWPLHAACRGHDPEMWTVGHEHNPRALAICGGCPVADQCLDYGTVTGSVGMIFGGRLLQAGRAGKWQPAVCIGCGARYVTRWRQQRYCSSRCARHKAAVLRAQRRERERAYAS